MSQKLEQQKYEVFVVYWSLMQMIMIIGRTFRDTILSIVLFLLLSVSNSFGQHSSEKELYSFKTTKGKKLCLSLDTLSNTMIYRFGKEEKVELEVMDDLNDTVVVFTHSWYLRPGGIENEGLTIDRIHFKQNEFEYIVTELKSAREEMPSVGIKVRNLESGETFWIDGKASTRKGALSVFHSKELVPVEWSSE